MMILTYICEETCKYHVFYLYFSILFSMGGCIQMYFKIIMNLESWNKSFQLITNQTSNRPFSCLKSSSWSECCCWRLNNDYEKMAAHTTPKYEQFWCWWRLSAETCLFFLPTIKLRLVFSPRLQCNFACYQNLLRKKTKADWWCSQADSLAPFLSSFTSLL